MIFFVHGGPGFNAFPELDLLQPIAQRQGCEIQFWNEPSVLRPAGFLFDADRAFSGQVASLDAFLPPSFETLICHSFGIHPFLQLQATKPRLIKKLILVTPAFDLEGAHQRIFNLAANDFARLAPDFAIEMKAETKKTRKIFDEASQKCLNLILKDPELLLNYWCNKNLFLKFVESMSRTESQFDIASFLAVLKEFGQQDRRFPGLLSKDIDEAILIFADQDPVSDQTSEVAAAKIVFGRELPVVVIPQAGHWPHLEQSEAFLKILRD